MINDVEKLKTRSIKYIKEFIENCIIDEKIDTHYITVDIISKNEIKIRKANGDDIDRVDLILNSMWNKLFLDWNYLMLLNKEWFSLHVGYTIKMFYFPCEKPLSTKYNSDIRYIFDKVLFNNTEFDAEYILSDLKFPDAYKIGYKCHLNKIENFKDIINDELNKLSSNEESVSEVFLKFVDKDNSTIYAVEQPEGYIFKYGKHIYQTIKNKANKIPQEKSSYEFLLSDFIKYCKTHNYTDKISQSYVKTVCNLFNDYIVNNEKVNHTMENNIDIEGIEPPYLGEKFDIGYEYIPDQVTKTLCKESELYKNIFKVLLANLRKGKDYKHCIFMSKKDVDDWNTLMKNIKIRTIYM